MKAGLITSVALHAALLGFGLVSLSAPRAFEVQLSQRMAAQQIIDGRLGILMAGGKLLGKPGQHQQAFGRFVRQLHQCTVAPIFSQQLFVRIHALRPIIQIDDMSTNPGVCGALAGRRKELFRAV